VVDASPVFLSETVLGILLRSSAEPRTSHVFVYLLGDSRIQRAASVEKAYEGDAIFSISGSRLMIAGVRRKYLFSQELKQEWAVSMKALCKEFPRTEIIGEAAPKGERAFRLTAVPTPIDNGPGSLLATSSDLLVYRVKEGIRTVDSAGAARGLIPVAESTEFYNSVEVAGPQRLYFAAAGDEHVVDLAGKVIARIRPPEGWGLRHGWNADGTRLLFDHYVRWLSVGDRITSWFAGAIGVTVPEQANAEVIRVIDVASGAICFGADGPKALLGVSGGYHADLSVSGRLLAVASRRSISVYALPAVCAK
jgi:hypothetical protein